MNSMSQFFFNKPCGLILFSICLFLFSNQSFAQNTFFSQAFEAPTTLTTEQSSRLNKADAQFPSSIKWFVTPESLIATQQDGHLLINDPEPSLNGNSILDFKVKSAEYNSENDYLWYGEVVPISDNSDYWASLMLAKKNGILGGTLVIEERTYDILDLSGNLVVLQRIPDNIGSGTCLPLIPENPTPVPTSSLLEADDREGNCDIRVLILYTQSAGALVSPTIGSRVNTMLAEIQTCFTNSNLYPNKVKFVLTEDGPVPVPASVGFSEAGLLMQDVLYDLTPGVSPTNTSLENFAKAARTQYSADLVFLLVDKTIMATESVLGIAYVGGAFSVLAATPGGKVFAHEAGHLFGCNHETCDALEANPMPTCNDAPNIGHAHTFKKGKKVKQTVLYGSAASSVISYYSNPFVNFENNDSYPTGILNSRDNASVIRTNACSKANLINSQNEPASLTTQGINVACGGSTNEFWAIVNGTGIQGYTIQWQSSTDGVNFGSVLNTSSYYSFALPQTAVEYMLFLRVKVTLPNAQVLTCTHYLKVLPCGGKTANEASLESTTMPLEIGITPNPAKSEVQIKIYSQTMLESANIILVNQYGERIKTIFGGYLDQGWTSHTIKVNSLASGNYIVVFQSEKGTVYQQLSVIH